MRAIWGNRVCHASPGDARLTALPARSLQTPGVHLDGSEAHEGLDGVIKGGLICAQQQVRHLQSQRLHGLV